MEKEIKNTGYKTKNTNTKILVLDIETTGFSHTKDCILELGAVTLDVETGKSRKAFHATFKEKHLRAKHQKAWIFNNSNMTLDEIRNSKDIEFYREDIQTLLTKYSGRTTAWNSSFDFDFLESRNFDLGKNKMPCPMKDSTKHFRLTQKNGKTPKWASVTEAVKLLGISDNFTEDHRGLEDARIEAECIYRLIKLGVYNV